VQAVRRSPAFRANPVSAFVKQLRAMVAAATVPPRQRPTLAGVLEALAGTRGERAAARWQAVCRKLQQLST
jgi:hypothetical protein